MVPLKAKLKWFLRAVVPSSYLSYCNKKKKLLIGQSVLKVNIQVFLSPVCPSGDRVIQPKLQKSHLLSLHVRGEAEL